MSSIERTEKSLSKVVEEMECALGEFSYGEIASHDFWLAQRGLNPKAGRFSTTHYALGAEELGRQIDDIYASASAGIRNPYAEFLIFMAANKQNEKDREGHEAVPIEMQRTQSAICDAELDLDSKERDHLPILDPLEAVLELDRSIAKMELAIENAKRT